jgi:DNA-binding NtrC family response regulator
MSGREAEPATGGARIILAYGEAVLRTALAEHLRGCGLDVIEAATSDEAMAALTEVNGPEDILLCDVAIPGTLGGFSLSIEARDRGLKVVLTGSLPGAVEAAVELCQHGSQQSKSEDAPALIEWIRQALARRAAEVG